LLNEKSRKNFSIHITRKESQQLHLKITKVGNLTGVYQKKSGYEIYELFVEGDNTVQGRIAFRIDGGVADVDIVEAAPHNIGHLGEYIGVGGHLFAIACKSSMEAGCDGYVAFTAKNKLVEHYKEVLGAQVLNGQRMYIDEATAHELIGKYLESR